MGLRSSGLWFETGGDGVKLGDGTGVVDIIDDGVIVVEIDWTSVDDRVRDVSEITEDDVFLALSELEREESTEVLEDTVKNKLETAEEGAMDWLTDCGTSVEEVELVTVIPLQVKFWASTASQVSFSRQGLGSQGSMSSWHNIPE